TTPRSCHASHSEASSCVAFSKRVAASLLLSAPPNFNALNPASKSRRPSLLTTFEPPWFLALFGSCGPVCPPAPPQPPGISTSTAPMAARTTPLHLCRNPRFLLTVHVLDDLRVWGFIPDPRPRAVFVLRGVARGVQTSEPFAEETGLV